MTRWFRFYDDVINDPKVLSLSDALRWAWVAILCIASKHEGKLPSIDHVSLMLRIPKARAATTLASLHAAGLLDKTETGFAPHNWNGRQYKSDVSTSRVKRFRNGRRNVSETPPETEAETDTDTDNSEANASGAEAPIDFRKKLFNEGLSKLATMTGKGPDACRSFVGKCLQAAGDDAVTVLGLIEDAERNQVVDPSAWIRARLPTTGPPGRPLTEFQASKLQTKDILNDLENFATGSSSGGQENPRLLPGHSGERSSAVRGGFGGQLVDVSPRGRRESG